jgi:acyl carrier protein
MGRGEEMRSIVEIEIQRILENSGRTYKAIADSDALFDVVGLDSLDLAQLVVILEQRLGHDPFRKPGRRIRTFGELVESYTQATP